MKSLLILVSVFLIANTSVFAEITEHIDDDEVAYLAKTYVTERSKFLLTGIETPALKAIIEKFRFNQIGDYRKRKEQLPQRRETSNCILCRFIFQAIIDQKRNQGFTEDQFRDEYVDLCVALNFETRTVCQGFANLNIPSIYYIMENRFNINEVILCGVILQMEGCEYNDSLFDFTAIVSPGGTPITQSKGPSPNPGTNSLKIVHFSDVHFDPTYSAGANALCGEPLCCGVQQGLPGVLFPENQAGYWGDQRNCDLPFRTIDDVLENIRIQHADADMIYYTGDTVNHRIWQSSVRSNTLAMTAVYDAFRTKFPEIPFFPVMGTHEPNPRNLFAPLYLARRDLSSEWVYDFHANQWAGSILPEETRETIRNGGYYTVLAREGLRIIALNNNECFHINHWMIYDPSYLTVQLNWLNEQLFAAEEAGEKVHILLHLPGGEGTCLNAWTREYRRIVDRYWDTISAQFNGHTHRDEFYVFYDLDNPDFAVNVEFNGGSVSPYFDVNPNYIVYNVDDNNFEVTSRQSIYTNLTEANLAGLRHPIWEQLYDFTDEWNVPNMSPAELDLMVHRLAANRADLTRYWEYRVKRGDRSLDAGCDDDCLLATLCGIVTTQFADRNKCDELTAIFNASS